jgi:PAS domain-containing protein
MPGWSATSRLARPTSSRTSPRFLSARLYWLFTGYSYALILSSIAFLLFSRREGASMARVQATPLLIGVVAPLATNILLITGIAPRAFDPMPFGIALTGIGLWWGAFRHRILDLVPVARQVLVDTLHEGILIVDREGRILDVNQHFASLAGVVPAAARGDDAGAVPAA